MPDFGWMRGLPHYAGLPLVMACPEADGPWQNIDKWEKVAYMRFARGRLGVAVVNGKIYAIGDSIIGGWPPLWYIDAKNLVGYNEEYDPVKGYLAYKASMPTPRAFFAIAVYKDSIHCIGSISSEGPTDVNEVYDPAVDAWETMASLPEEAWTSWPYNVYEAVAAVLDDKIHVVISGGTHYVYDPTINAWIKKAPLLGSESNILAVVNGKIYAISYGSIHVYDVEKDTWVSGKAAPLSLYYAAVTATTGIIAPKQICVFGTHLLIVPGFLVAPLLLLRHTHTFQIMILGSDALTCLQDAFT